MSITRSQIARQMYADGALVDPRMANTLEQNKAINNANAQINQAMRSSGGLKSLYDQYGISDADRSRLSGGMASRDMILQNSHREELVKQLAGLQNQNVVYSSYRPPKPPTDMFGILISDHNKYGVGSDPTKVSETDMNAFRQRVLDSQKNYYQKELDLINQDYISSGYPDQARTLEEYMRSIGAYAKGGRAGYAYGGRGYNDYASPSSTRAQKATQLLNEMAPKGEKLAYINNREAELLKRMGGAGVDINKTGIKSYVNFGSGRGSVSESLSQAAFGSSGPTFSSDGGSGSFTPKGNFATITKGGNDTQRTIPENYFTPSKTGTNIARVANFLVNPRMISKKFMDDKIKEQYEKELQVAKDVTTARNTGFGQAIGSQYFGPMNTKAMQSYKNVVGGFPNTDPFVDTGGGDNQIIPRMQMIAEAPSDVESTSSDFDLYAALEGREGMRFGENPYGIMGVTQRFAGGGEVRQAYGLGKLVKKATRAVKKVLKSDIGKAALLYAGGTYLGGMKAFSGSGIGGAGGLKNFGFQNFGKRLLNPTGTDGISNFLLNPFGKSVEKGITLEPESVKNFAEKYGMTNSEALKYLTSQQNTPVPGYVKYGIPTAMAATYFLSKKEEPDDLDQEIAQNYTDNSGLKEQLATYKPFRFEVPKEYQLAANGGRMGYEEGGNINPADLPMSRESLPTYEDIETGEEVEYPYKNKERSSAPDIDAELFQMYLDAIGSGKIPRSTTFDQYKELMSDRVGAKEGGLMDLGGMEKDYRAEGGFVPIGKAEKADDVPARLSKNEFVFTADAVRNAGGGDVDKGAEVMYNVMKNLESGGKISEKSQGLQGARNMFQTSQKLGEIL
jgi:hypothetical protein